MKASPGEYLRFWCSAFLASEVFVRVADAGGTAAVAGWVPAVVLLLCCCSVAASSAAALHAGPMLGTSAFGVICGMRSASVVATLR